MNAAAQRRDQLERVVAVVWEALGSNVMAVYLYGSSVAGGLRPYSDIDLFVVLERRTTPTDKQALVDALGPVSSLGRRPASWHPVEVTTVVVSDVRPWRYPPLMDFQYGEWLRAQLDSGNLGDWPAEQPDLALEIAQVHLVGEPLVGPAATELLDPVPADDLRRAMLDGIDGLLANLDSDMTNVLLTLARIWSSLVEPGFRPKDSAADWALERLPDEHQPAIAHARAAYLGVEDDTWPMPPADAGRAASFIVDRVREAG